MGRGTIALMDYGLDPNIAMREIAAYLAGHSFDVDMLNQVIADVGPPPQMPPQIYNRARQRWIETGDITALMQMIDAVTLES
jgi:hypothetical protein